MKRTTKSTKTDYNNHKNHKAMMPGTIDDISQDNGAIQEAELYTENIMKRFGVSRIDELPEILRYVIKKAYLSGMQSGFKTGLRIAEVRGK